MTLISHRLVRDRHGHERTETSLSCDGPDCDRTVVNDPLVDAESQEFNVWLVVIGADDGEHFCSRRCLTAWATAPDAAEAAEERAHEADEDERQRRHDAMLDATEDDVRP